MILIIDNYDSFSYNLAQVAGAFKPSVRVVRNDEVTAEEVKDLHPSHLILSPGPGRPGICEDLVRLMHKFVPILGINLGCQVIAKVFGASLVPAKRLLHGKAGSIHIANGNRIFQGLPPVIQGARYDSRSILRKTLPEKLLIIAEDEEREVMGIKHKDYELYGLQFHPESILTPQGQVIINNFLQIGGGEDD
ncbi:MAG: aminodeoxychorismate/anthranilate synthase component II [Firmicutes bacterium]|nr:aminodeoxychorismate/anthranilate synthase component II [Bacillota bacterium]